MRRMMLAPDAPITPDLLATLDQGQRNAVIGALPVELDAPALDAGLSAIADRLTVASPAEALELRRVERALELELSRVLEA